MINLHTCSLEKLERVIENAQIAHARYLKCGMYGCAGASAKFLSIAVTILIMRRLDERA